MGIVIIDIDYLGEIVNYLLIVGALVITAGMVWFYNYKERWISQYKKLDEDLDRSLVSAYKSAFIYVTAVMPIMLLLHTGASQMILTKPNWNLPLSIFVVIVNLTLLLLLVALTLYSFGKSSVLLWAAEINLWVRDNRPLQYYESKRSFHKHSKIIQHKN